MSIIPFDRRDGFIWMNGEIVPWGQATTHVLTHGLHYGSAVFEGERVYSGRIFKMREHGQRLIRSGQMLGFDIPYSAEALDAAAMDIVKKQGVVNGYVRRIAWRGSEMMAISAQHNRIHVAIACWDWPNMYKDVLKDSGIKLAMAQWKRPSPETAPCASKAAGLYMICTLSKHEAERQGFQDALMLDWRGYVAEATGANVFFVMDGALHTPTPDCFLDGITRRTVIDLARAAGIEVIERHIKPEEIGRAQEVFLTGTAAEITPVGQIAEHHFQVSEVTRRIQQDYRELVHQSG